MPSGKKSKAQRRAAGATPPPVQSKGGSRRGGFSLSEYRWWIAGAAAVVIGVVVAAIALAGGGSTKPVHVDFAQLSGLQNGPPPWNNGAGELQQHLTAVHLSALSQEGSVEHIHMHLDVYVNGKHVTLPAGIGIYDNSFLTELHTHTPDGVIHLESPKKKPFTLGQFIGEWSVRLNASCLGRYCGSLHWWVNGVRQTGNPANLVLNAHQEIVIATGKAPAHVPASYKFPAGE